MFVKCGFEPAVAQAATPEPLRRKRVHFLDDFARIDISSTIRRNTLRYSALQAPEGRAPLTAVSKYLEKGYWCRFLWKRTNFGILNQINAISQGDRVMLAGLC